MSPMTPAERDRHTIMLYVGGSHAYGMATETSDIDIRGVFHVPQEHRDNPFSQVGAWVNNGVEKPWGFISEFALGELTEFEKACFKRTGSLDVQMHPIGDFVQHVTKANPNVLEHLFADRYLYMHRSFEVFLEGREAFLSKQRCFSAFTGFARGQIKRIETHRSWLLNPPKAPPTRAEFGLPEAPALSDDARNHIRQVSTAVMKQWSTEQGFDGLLEGTARQMVQARLEEFQKDLMSEYPSIMSLEDLAEQRMGLSEDIRLVLQGERRLAAAQKNWNLYQKWLRTRNGDRAELERKYGFDSKHGAHSIRALRSGLELIRDGVLKVRRDDAEELLAIRNGSMTYEELTEEAERLYQASKDALASSPLPDQPDFDAILAMVQKARETFA